MAILQVQSINNHTLNPSVKAAKALKEKIAKKAVILFPIFKWKMKQLLYNTTHKV